MVTVFINNICYFINNNNLWFKRYAEHRIGYDISRFETHGSRRNLSLMDQHCKDRPHQRWCYGTLRPVHGHLCKNSVKISQIAAELWRFSFFQIAAGRRLGFCYQQVKNDATARCGLSMSTTAPNLVTMSQMAAELLRFSVFQNGGQPPSWILFPDHPRSQNDDLKPRLKLYVIRFILSKILRFQFSNIWLKCLYRAQKLGLRDFAPKHFGLSTYHGDPQKALPCAEPRILT